ncbi:PAS domain S-box protein [Sphingomonas sp. GCM10030256]|uniref:PAS domain-containing sensor histidine kinase n=1 Tax=Sphingomonas sp. GCM10030256 TaxID=3273427 RepID=UPI003605DE44
MTSTQASEAHSNRTGISGSRPPRETIDLLVAALAFAVAWAASLVLGPWLGTGAPLLLYLLPLIASALFLSRPAALLVSVLALLTGVIGFGRDGSSSADNIVQLGVFALVCGGVLTLTNRTARLRQRDARLREEAERSSALLQAAETATRQRELHLRSILATAPEAMIVINERGRIQSFSATAETMFGFTEAEVVGENVSALMPSPDRERHDAYLGRYLCTGERKIIGIGRVTNARRRDGTTFPIHLHVGETRIGEQRMFTGFIEDLTERHETEHRIHDLQAELAHVSRVAAMGTLATSLAHELNQPLTAIANYTSTAKHLLSEPRGENLDFVREALGECATQSLRAGQIVHRLRDFIGRGDGERRIEPLSRLVSEASALALVGTAGLDIDFDMSIPTDCEEVVVDRIQIQQVLLNLLRNATEAMRPCAVRRLAVSASRADHGLVEVLVADSGPGLALDVAERLFQPFVSTKVEGMGVGLSICRSIVAEHGGTIWTKPSPFGGTAFHFTLPAGATADE